MINRDKSVSKEELKKWFQVAKRRKDVCALYKLDNVLKNTWGYENQGLTRYIDICKRNETLIELQLMNFVKRFKHSSLKETLSIDYNLVKIR